MKKIISLILVCILLSSVIVVNAAQLYTPELCYDATDEQCISLDEAIKAYEEENNITLETYRNYFYIPNGDERCFKDEEKEIPSWSNEYSNDICIWYSISEGDSINAPVPESYCGYSINKTDIENIYYADIPVAVTSFMLNNGVDTITDKPALSTCYSPFIGPIHNGTNNENFTDCDNMIYVLNDYDSITSTYSAHFMGEWYYYLKDSCYSDTEDGECVNPDHSHSINNAIANYEFKAGETIDTNRYYFLMPNGNNGFKSNGEIYEAGEFLPSWYNDYSNKPSIHWSDSGILDTDYPGYTMIQSKSESIYYADVPVAVTALSFNNGVDYHCDPDMQIYGKTTVNIGSEYYDPGESENYPDGTDCFNNMIYVLDPNKTAWADHPYMLVGQETGEWYYYYGDGCFGTIKNGTSTNCIRDDHDHPVHRESLKDAVEKYETETGEKLETDRYYFLMPNGSNGKIGKDGNGFYYNKYMDSWYNSYTTTAGVYWWEGNTLIPKIWPGYTIDESDSDDVYYADIPKDVEIIIFNNYINGGSDTSSDVYEKSQQTSYVFLFDYESYETNPRPYKDMIYVMDPDVNNFNDFPTRLTFGGDWYYYYGDGCYGTKKDGDCSNCIREDHDHCPLGDVDMDKEISTIDATLIQRAVAQINVLNNKQKIKADMNNDKEITVLDATLVQRKVANLD